jgi:hypothetical protein
VTFYSDKFLTVAYPLITPAVKPIVNESVVTFAMIADLSLVEIKKPAVLISTVIYVKTDCQFSF